MSKVLYFIKVSQALWLHTMFRDMTNYKILLKQAIARSKSLFLMQVKQGPQAVL